MVSMEPLKGHAMMMIKKEKKKVRDGRKDYILMILCSLVKCLRSPDKLCNCLQNFYDGNNIGGKAISALMGMITMFFRRMQKFCDRMQRFSGEHNTFARERHTFVSKHKISYLSFFPITMSP